VSGDHELLAGVAGRDPEAFRTLMERYSAGVINLASRFLGVRADAEEVAQDLFFRLYQRPPVLEPTGKLFTWIYRVTVNLCLDRLRRRSREAGTFSLEAPLPGEIDGEKSFLDERLSDSSATGPRERVIQAEQAAAARQAVAALPEVLRAPLILSTFEDLSHEQIAKILKISPKAVERRLSRARSLLKSRLAPYL